MLSFFLNSNFGYLSSKTNCTCKPKRKKEKKLKTFLAMQKNLHQENRVDRIKLPTNSCIKLELGQWNSFNNYLWVFNCCYDYSFMSCEKFKLWVSPPNPSKLQNYCAHWVGRTSQGANDETKKFEMSFENAIMQLFVWILSYYVVLM
jgi:hypothetical protein